MKLANINGRMAIVGKDGIADIANASNGKLPSDPLAAYEVWDKVRDWAAGYTGGATAAFNEDNTLAPVPMPRQVFGIGLNYASHAKEAGLSIPTEPLTFTKFPTCICGPRDNIQLSGSTDDWEVEMVVVIGKRAHKAKAANAWDYIAGLTLGQDISNRVVQRQPKERPQFNLGKSFPTFGPTGPVVATADEFRNPDDVWLKCSLDGEVLQDGRTSDLIFPVAELIERLSHNVILLPGDLIFTGTTSGIGSTRQPPRFLGAGQILVSEMEAVGKLVNRCIAPI